MTWSLQLMMPEQQSQHGPDRPIATGGSDGHLRTAVPTPHPALSSLSTSHMPNGNFHFVKNVEICHSAAIAENTRVPFSAV